MPRKLIISVFLFLLFAMPVGAATVTVMVMETGLPKDGLPNQYSIMWENGIMEVLFESGHIVSNSPILRLTQKPVDGFPDEAETDYKDAQEGGMDYFIVIVIDYPSPYKVSVRLFSTKSTEIIQERTYTDNPAQTTSIRYERIKDAIAGISARLR